MTRGSAIAARARSRPVLAVLVLALLVGAALVVPHPSVETMRSWSASWGPWFPVWFVVLHTLVCVAPVPRTLFTVAAAVLFGIPTALTVTVLASTFSAVLALLIVRSVGRDLVAARLTHPALAAVDARLARRGWLAVLSLRLIAPVPFSVVNYCAGVSAVRVVPFALATLFGVVPGTTAIVLVAHTLGAGALSGETDPRLVVASGVCIAIGSIGLIADARLPLGRRRGTEHGGIRQLPTVD